jgi:hypothetical protein
MSRGPVEVVVLTFPADTATARVADVVRAMTASDAVALIDLVLLVSEDGEAVAVDLEKVDDPAFADIELEPATVLSVEDLEGVAASLSTDRLAAVLAVEHRWAVLAAKELESTGGTLALHLRVPPEVAEAAFRAADEREG